MKEKIRIIYRQPLHTAREMTVDNTLEAVQELVGGYIETVPLNMPGVILVCNEEGKLRGMKPNPYPGIPDLVGPWFICGVSGEEFDDVPREFVKLVRAVMTVRRESEVGKKR